MQTTANMASASAPLSLQLGGTVTTDQKSFHNEVRAVYSPDYLTCEQLGDLLTRANRYYPTGHFRTSRSLGKMKLISEFIRLRKLIGLNIAAVLHLLTFTGRQDYPQHMLMSGASRFHLMSDVQ